MELPQLGEINKIPVFYINLDRAIERKALIESNLRKLGLVGRRIQAVDAKHIVPKNFPNLRPYSYYNDRWEINNFSIAVFESHRQAWKAAYASGHPFSIILEDDLMFGNNFIDVLENLKPAIRDFDILRLNTFAQTRVLGNTPPLNGVIQIKSILQSMADAGAYILTNASCERLLEDSESYCDHVDDFIFSPERNLRTFQLINPICGQFIHEASVATEVEKTGILISARNTTGNENKTPAKGPIWFRFKKEISRAHKKYNLRRLVQNGKASRVSGILNIKMTATADEIKGNAL